MSNRYGITSTVSPCLGHMPPSTVIPVIQRLPRGVYIGLSMDCVSCHLKDYQGATSPNHASANFPLTCQTCHGVDRWQGAKFNHAQVTGFALVGAHAQLECSSCHKGQQFKGTPRDCFGCHAQDYNRTTNPNHVAANFPKDCAICHDSEHWQGVRFDHSQTGFALTGAHVTARCDTCHQAGRYKGTPRECFSCHVAKYEGTQNPDHRKANISTQCDSCHTTSNWQGAKFDHTLTKFALTGAHVSVNCTQCHVKASFREPPRTVSCLIAAISQLTTKPLTRTIRRQVFLRTARSVIRLSSGKAQSLTITTPNLPLPGLIAQSVVPNVMWEGGMPELRPIASPVI